MEISASEVKKLRELTSAGMMDCKKALQESNGDFEKAKLLLKEKGQSKADSKSGRTTAQGLVSVKVCLDNKVAVILEVNCETDFAAKDQQFIDFSKNILEAIVEGDVGDLDSLLSSPINDFDTVEDYRTHVISKLGENISLRRFNKVSIEGTLGTYIHADKIAVIALIDSDNETLAKDIAMHVAASNPHYIDQSEISNELLEEESRILALQAEKEGKPKEIIEKIVQGKLNKKMNQLTLMGQEFIKDPDITIEQLLNDSNAKVNSFIRYEVGDGIEQEEVNFADEVKAQVEATQ
jgi:elongation factor Ts|tara:strand:- start:2430 stop:3311 length:882 start_codon:yes stop_codon:yes gene_type:complete